MVAAGVDLGRAMGRASLQPLKRGRKLVAADRIAQVVAVDQLIRDQTGKSNLRKTARICRMAWETVNKILTGKHGQPSANLGSTLAAGEEVCDPPARCEDGHLCGVFPCRTCGKGKKSAKGRADLERLQSLGREAKSRHPSGFSTRRPRRHSGDPAQRLLPLELADGHNLALEPLRQDTLALKRQHIARLNQVRASQVKARQRSAVDPENLPF